MNINFLDVIILCILAFFSIRGLMHGFVDEIIGLIAIFGGLYLANNFYADLAIYIDFIQEPLWKNLAAYIIIVVAVIIVMKIVHSLLQKIMNFSFVGWIDSIGGLIIGGIKGLLLCAIMLILIDTFSPSVEMIEQSYLVPYLDEVLSFANDYIPLNIFNEPTI